MPHAAEAPLQNSPAHQEFVPAFVPDAPKSQFAPAPEMTDFHSDVHEVADYTMNWKKLRALKNQETEVYGGRAVIERDGRVTGGVSVGNYNAEAITVDNAARLDGEGQVHLGPYNRLMTLAEQKIAGANSTEKHADVALLRAIYESVDETMKYSLEDVKDLVNKLSDKNPDGTVIKGKKITLSLFMSEGIGVCRHMGLSIAAVSEMFQAQGKMPGAISFDRNINWVDQSEPGGHAWMRYTAPGGEVYIADVAQHYFGKLADTLENPTWSYFRDATEKQRYTDERKARYALSAAHNSSKNWRPEQQPQAEGKIPEEISRGIIALEKGYRKYAPEGEPLDAESLRLIKQGSRNVLGLVMDQLKLDKDDPHMDSLKAEVLANELADIFQGISGGYMVQRLYDKGLLPSLSERKDWLQRVVETIYSFGEDKPELTFDMAKLRAHAARKTAKILVKR